MEWVMPHEAELLGRELDKMMRDGFRSAIVNPECLCTCGEYKHPDSIHCADCADRIRSIHADEQNALRGDEIPYQRKPCYQCDVCIGDNTKDSRARVCASKRNERMRNEGMVRYG